MIDSGRKILTIFVIAAFFLSISPVDLEAFESVTAARYTFGVIGKEPVHTQITNESFKNSEKDGINFSKQARDRINKGNTQRDLDDMTMDWKTNIVTTKKYRPGHHFDREDTVKNGTDGTTANTKAAKDGREYIDEEVDNIGGYLRTPSSDNYAKALDSLGRATHALQDYFSHSNFIELSEVDQKKAEDFLLGKTNEPPFTLKLTGYGTESDDAYPHDKNKLSGGKAKDSESCADGKKAFKKARDAAVKNTAEFYKELNKRSRSGGGSLLSMFFAEEE